MDWVFLELSDVYTNIINDANIIFIDWFVLTSLLLRPCERRAIGEMTVLLGEYKIEYKKFFVSLESLVKLSFLFYFFKKISWFFF